MNIILILAASLVGTLDRSGSVEQPTTSWYNAYESNASKHPKLEKEKHSLCISHFSKNCRSVHNCVQLAMI